MFNYCPSCASQKIVFSEDKCFRCPDCGFVYYHNIAAATGLLIVVPDTDGEEKLVFTVRKKDPAAGKLDLPGGFVDKGEGVTEGLYRELQEELGWAPVIPDGAALNDVFTLFASFSNVYEYKGINYNTCDMYFLLRAPGLKTDDFRLEQSEISEVRFLKASEIDFSQLAFSSTVQVVKAYLKI